MSSAENKNGRYPIMQNPGVPGISENTVFPRKHVLIINGETVANPNGYDQKVLLYPIGVNPPTDEDEAQVLVETTLKM